METVCIEPMTAATCAGRAFVHYTSWEETYRGLMPDEFLNARTLQGCEEIARESLGNPTLVARVGEEIIGFCCWLPAARDFVSVPDACEVTALYLLRTWHGRGVGKALLQAALAELDKTAHRRPVVLFVLKGNDHAIEFYKRQGFAFTGKTLEDQTPCGTLTELEMVKN